MRIVVVNNFFPPRVGGSSHLSDALARGYARLGHEVLVVTTAYQGAPAEEEREGVRVVRVPAYTLPESRINVSFDLSFATRPGLRSRLRGLLDDFRPDVFHQHGQFMDLTWATGAYARRRGVPALLSIHTRLENPAAHYSHAFRGLDAVVVAPRLRWYKPSMVVMDSYMRDYITDRYSGCYRDLVPIPVGVDPTWVRGGSRSEGRRLMGVPDDVPVILSVGHVIPLRDRLNVVEAMPQVLAKHPETVLVVAGRVYYDAFQRRAEELGVTSSVKVLGEVPKSAIPHLMAAGDVESHEQGWGLGTATLESMAAGLPVVGWGRVDNFPDVPLVDGHDVLLAAPGDVDGLADRLCAALDDPAYRRALGDRSRLLVDRHFSLDRVLARHVNELSALTGARSTPTPG